MIIIKIEAIFHKRVNFIKKDNQRVGELIIRCDAMSFNLNDNLKRK